MEERIEIFINKSSLKLKITIQKTHKDWSNPARVKCLFYNNSRLILSLLLIFILTNTIKKDYKKPVNVEYINFCLLYVLFN